MPTEREALEARLKAAKEKRAEIDHARAEREALDQLRLQVEREENATRDAPHIAAAEAEHGTEKIAVLETMLGAIVIKRPNHLHHKKFANRSEKVTTDDLLAYVKPCLVYPDAKRLEAMLEELPGALIPLSDLAFELARGGAKGVEKK